jgi:hypothetical protein
MYAEIATNTRDQRFEIASADPDQRLAPAAGTQRHPEAEQKSADRHRQPRNAAARVQGLRQIDETRSLQRAGAGDRDGHREQPHPQPPRIAEVHDVADRAHRAEVHTRRDRAEDRGEHERGACDEPR